MSTVQESIRIVKVKKTKDRRREKRIAQGN